MEKQNPLVINLALTGIIPQKQDNPLVPLSPEEIAADVECCYHAGARVFHLHARKKNGESSCDRGLFGEIMRLVKQTTPQAIICLTTSGRRHKTFAERSAALDLTGELKPDLASLTLGSMNFSREASINDPEMIAQLATCMNERGIVPELEVFDLGMIDYAHFLITRGILKQPFVFNLLLGSLGTLAATPLNLALMVERLPPGSFWNAAGIGRFQFPMNALGIVMGGHVRTGLEDNLYLDAAKTDPVSNERLVQHLGQLAQNYGRSLATPEQARQMLGLGS